MKKTMAQNKIVEDFLSLNVSSDDIEFEERIINSDIVQIIKKIMKRNKYNQEKLAEKLGISPAHVSKLFSGEKKLNLNIIAKIQMIFDVRFKLYIKEDFNEEIPNMRAILESNMKETIRGVDNEIGCSYDIREERIISSKNVSTKIPYEINTLSYS